MQSQDIEPRQQQQNKQTKNPHIKKKTAGKMVVNTIDMNMQVSDKKLTACILLFVLQLFIDGKILGLHKLCRNS